MDENDYLLNKSSNEPENLFLCEEVNSILYMLILCSMLLYTGLWALAVTLAAIVIWGVQYFNRLRSSMAGNFLQTIALYGIIKELLSIFLPASRTIIVFYGSYMKFATFLNVLQCFETGSNIGFVWLLTMHTVLKTTYICYSKFKAIYYVNGLIIGAVTFFTFFVGIQHTLHLGFLNFTTCFDFPTNSSQVFFQVDLQRYVISFVIRCILKHLPSVAKVICALYLHYYVQYILTDRWQHSIVSTTVLNFHVYPAFCVIGIQFFRDLLEGIYFFYKTTDKNRSNIKNYALYGFSEVFSDSLMCVLVMSSFLRDAIFANGKYVYLSLSSVISTHNSYLKF